MEIVNNAMEVAVASKDEALTNSYTRTLKVINRIGKFNQELKRHDIQALYFLADTGARTCCMVQENCHNLDIFDKASVLRETYNNIKTRLEGLYPDEIKADGEEG